MHRNALRRRVCMGLRLGLPVGPIRPFGHSASPTYQLKPPSAGEPGCMPLCEIDRRQVEVALSTSYGLPWSASRSSSSSPGQL